MPWFIPLIIAAGGAISGALNEQAKANAISGQQNSAKEMAGEWTGIYKNLVGEGDTSYNNAVGESGVRYKMGANVIQGMLGDNGPLAGILKTLKATSSTLGDQSGKPGQGIEAFVDPTVIKAKKQMASDLSVAGLNLFGNFINTQNSLANSNLARLGNLAGGAMGNAGQSGQSLVNSMGNYTQPVTGTSLAAVGAGISIADYLKRNSAGSTAAGGTSNG